MKSSFGMLSKGICGTGGAAAMGGGTKGLTRPVRPHPPAKRPVEIQILVSLFIGNYESLTSSDNQWGDNDNGGVSDLLSFTKEILSVVQRSLRVLT